MIYLDTPLPANFRIYDAQIKWLAPGGLTPNQLADRMLSQWAIHRTVKVRHGLHPTRDAAMRLISENVRLMLNDTLVGFQNPQGPAIAPAPPARPRPKASRCCGR